MTDLRTIRTDVVGSLLRPAAVKEARQKFDEGKIDAAELHRIEDDAIRDAVKLQESTGLDVVSDGEMRRLNFQDSFGAAVEGYDASASTMQVYTQRVEGAAGLARVAAGARRVLGHVGGLGRPQFLEIVRAGVDPRDMERVHDAGEGKRGQDPDDGDDDQQLDQGEPFDSDRAAVLPQGRA